MTDERSLFLVNAWAENIAEILVFDDRDYVILMPMYGMFKMYENDMSNPISAYGSAPYRMPKSSFLNYVASVCGYLPDKTVSHYILRGLGLDNRHYSIPLVRSMPANDLAQLVGLSIENVREFLANHLTFSQSTDEPTQQS